MGERSNMSRLFSIIGAPFGYGANEEECFDTPKIIHENGIDQKIK